MDRQLSLIYFSATDTTAKVVKEVASSINNEFKEYNITYPDHRLDRLSFDSKDIVIVGVPVYAGRVPQFLTDYFKKLKGNNTLAAFIVVYGNRDYDDALLELKNTFEENGFIGIAGGAFIGEHSYTSKVAAGRPDVNDLKIAKIFGTKINEKLHAIGDDDFTESELVVKGKYPYKERTSSILIAPITNDKCINCGVCAEHCPMNAISKDDFKDADPTKCIRCCSCIKRCPVNAKSINHETFAKITQMLLDKCTLHRHEPEYFI